jgi:hypothetical protein
VVLTQTEFQHLPRGNDFLVHGLTRGRLSDADVAMRTARQLQKETSFHRLARRGSSAPRNRLRLLTQCLPTANVALAKT